jgi:hypothetical protein
LTDFQGKASNLVNTNLIKRYNYYSMRILESMEENSSNGEASSASSIKKIRPNEEIKDLEKDEMHTLRGALLNLAHVDRYFYAPKTDNTKKSQLESVLRSQNPKQLCESSLTQANNWNMNIKKVYIESELSLIKA